MFKFRFWGKRDLRVKKQQKNVEPQDVFLDKLSRKKEEELGISEQKFETPLPKWVLQLFGLMVFLLLLILLGKSFHMQVIRGEDYQARARRNVAIIEPARVLRGVIYDSDGKQLVYNKVSFDIYANSQRLEKIELMASKLSEILKPSKEEILKILKDVDGEERIFSDISHEAAIIIKIKEQKFPGISIERIIERRYEDGNIFAHILGYTGEVTRNDIARNPERYTLHDYIGKAGLERFYDKALAKDRGFFKIETDAQGNLISREEVDPVSPGHNLKLWVDIGLQEKIVEVTKTVLEDIGSKKASVVAIDPQTGGVLSMVSIPSYDNNVFSRTGDKELLNQFLTDKEGVFLNRTIETEYAAGSVIKPFLAVAALEEEIISPDKEIYSPGYLDIPNPWNPANPTRMLDFKPHGWTNMKEAIAVSSNVYFYTIGGGYKDQEGLGIKRIKEYLELFGWGEKTGIDLPQEKKGLIPDPEWKINNIGLPWTLGDTYNTAIGQGYLLITPLQLAVSYSALVNGGKVISPKIVQAIQENGTTVEKPKQKIIREGFISSDNLEIVKEGMKMTTIEGTATRLGRLPFETGAKTGTAEISKPGYYHNWIAVFAPYDDPEIVLVVLVEEVEGIKATASAIAYDVLNWYFEQKNEN